MQKPMRVLFIMNSLGFGGAERQTLSLLRALDTARFDGRLAVLQERPREMSEAAELPSSTIWRAHVRRGFDIAALRRLSGFVRRLRPDVIVSVNTFPLLAGTLAKLAAGSKAPLVNVFHTTEIHDPKGRRLFPFFRWLMNRAEAVVYVCDSQRRYWTERGLSRNNACVIHNGIDSSYLSFSQEDSARAALRNSLGMEEHDIVVGICAGLRPEKAHSDLIKAIHTLRERGKPFKCLIIGDGPCRAELERLIEELDLGNVIRLLGTQSDVRPFIDACDVMALVSHSVETFSLAALESMALRRPIVLSNVGGAPEQVQEGFNGFLFPKGDIDALVERLEALESHETRENLGRNGRCLLEQHFLRETMVEKYSRLIESLAHSC